MKKNSPRRIELLAPAKDAATAITAIRHGADAVYIGSEGFGARAAASNSVEDIRQVVLFAHRFHAKVYVTFNTLIYENELETARRLIIRLYEAGVDALIVQDLSLLKMDIPPIQLHASTQADIRTPEKALFFQNAGFSQIVLPREMGPDEIAEIADTVDVPLEVFVHGALCVSYSGACKASFLACGRSANRGDCAQMCRQNYDLEDKDGNVIVRDKYLLSLKDMNRLAFLEKLMKAGASSFKIEGRLKDETYVKNVVGAYRRELDRIIGANPDLYCRASAGETVLDFEPDVRLAFNRGFTPYFADTRQPESIASADTPKSIGVAVGKIAGVSGNTIRIIAGTPLCNGDGLGFFNRAGRFTGFRANRIEGDRIFLRESIGDIPRGAILYRNKDTRRDAELAREDTAQRTIPADVTLSLLPDNRIAAEFAADGFGHTVTAIDADVQKAVRPVESGSRRNIFKKLGETDLRLREFRDNIPSDIFIPNSQLTLLRRKAAESMVHTIAARRPLCIAGNRASGLRFPPGESADNVANALACALYSETGAVKIGKAAETLGKRALASEEITVMECRYCIRRELGACLKSAGHGRLPSLLYLRTGNIKYRLDFDCARCMMKVTANPT